jgi:hypothetical protein
MVLIGVDYHPSFQQIAFFEEETGECGEQQLSMGFSKDFPPSIVESLCPLCAKLNRVSSVSMGSWEGVYPCRLGKKNFGMPP